MILTSYGKSTWLPVGAALVAAAVAGFFFLWPIGILCCLALLFVIQFFRDPDRRPDAPVNAVIAPADGKVVEVAEADEPHHIAGRARKIAIFMSVFDAHVNRAPVAGKVEWVRREAGGFMNALRPQASIENERMLVALRDEAGRPVLLKLVAGLVARRIVCPLEPGDSVERGERIGMIKFGSRAEVFLPAGDQFKPSVRLGQHVRAGETVLGVRR